MTRNLIACLALAGVLFGLASCARTGADPGERKPTVAYVTNGIASFWVVAEKGARAAARDFDANVEIRMPPDGVGDQRARAIREGLSRMAESSILERYV
jgi:ribose transport system substrate-binding protein